MTSKSSIQHFHTGAEHSDRERRHEAIHEFTIAIQLSPDWSLPYMWRGFEYEDLRMFAEAEADFSQVIKLCQTTDTELLAEAHAARGRVRRRQLKLAEALGDYTQELTLNPKSAMGYLDRSLVYDAMGNDELAVADYQAAIFLDPSVIDLAKGHPRGWKGQPTSRPD